VKDDLDADLACALARTMFDKRDELSRANASAAGIGPDPARKPTPSRCIVAPRRHSTELGAE
jgi:hypothetical protein